MTDPIDLSGPIPDLKQATDLKGRVVEVLQTC